MIPGHSTIKNTITAILVYSTFACLGMGATGETGNHIVVRVDRTTRDWSDLAMGPPSASDDADRAQNPRAEFRVGIWLREATYRRGFIWKHAAEIEQRKIPHQRR